MADPVDGATLLAAIQQQFAVQESRQQQFETLLQSLSDEVKAIRRPAVSGRTDSSTFSVRGDDQLMLDSAEEVPNLELKFLYRLITENNKKKVEIKPPEPFDGRRNKRAIDQWTFKMDTYFANHELVEPKKMALAASLLKDTAFLWWQRRVALWKTTHTWDKFKRALCKAFIPASADFHARSALRHLCQTGSVATYISQFQKLNLEIMTLSPDDFLRYFIDGLEPNLRDDVHKANPLTVEDAISYVNA
ncbi:hypothetical protein L7F22_006173 [Adiantum nelumboides]|nr:hypothetical protein [Adiantum nelumboides]